MEVLVGGVIVLGLLAWMLFSRGRRSSHQPHA
jgi:hypothetical protein